MEKKAKERTSLRRFLRDEDGIVAIIFVILLPVFVAVAALAIDMGYAYWKRNTVQVDASASSLAGAGRLMDDGIYDPTIDSIVYSTVDKDGDGVPDNDDSDFDGVPDGAVVLNEALLYAEKNIPNEDILAVVDLLPGNWEPTSRTFTRAGTWDPDTKIFTQDPATFDTASATFGPPNDLVTPLNAVLAITRRADTGPNDNPLGLFLARAVGLPTVNINTPAVATVGAGDRFGASGCIVSLNETEPKSLHVFGTADVTAFNCDINVNSSDPCALYANGNPSVTVGTNPDDPDSTGGGIYVVGDGEGNGVCTAGTQVEFNCADDVANCPDVDEEYYLEDPYSYYHDSATTVGSQLDTVQGLECGYEFVNDDTSLYWSSRTLADAYSADPSYSLDPAAEGHTGIGNFKIDGQTTVQLQLDADGNPIKETTVTVVVDGVETTETITCANPGEFLDTGNTCQQIVTHDGSGACSDDVSTCTITPTGLAATDLGDWTYNPDPTYNAGEGRFEFTMYPGAYCGGIEVRGGPLSTVVFTDGDYVLKGKEAAGITSGPKANEFDVRAAVAIEGTNVAYYLADEYVNINWGGTASLGGTAEVALTGRHDEGLDVDDPLEGFLIFADPSNTLEHMLRGTPDGAMMGILYFPEADVQFKGIAGGEMPEGSGAGVCTVLIADEIYFNGTTALTTSLDGCGTGFDIPPTGADLVVRLVH